MQKRAQITRDRILAAALENFSRSGFNGATIDVIAADAGVNKQRIYAYYGSKRGLFNAALAASFAAGELISMAHLKEAAEHLEHLSTIVLKGFMELHEHNPHFWRLLAWANLEGELDDGSLSEVRRKENAELRRLFDQAIAAGLLRPISFESYLLMLLSVAYFIYSNRKTLSRTLGSDYFTPEQLGKLPLEIESILTP